jgi:hypothetical protein
MDLTALIERLRLLAAREPPPGAADPQPPTALTRGESELAKGVREGNEVDLRSLVSSERVVRAAFLRTLVMEAVRAAPTGVRLTGATVDGDLDLSYVQFARPLSFADCRFQGRVRLGRCRIPALDLIECVLEKGVWAASLDVAHSLDLESSEVHGGIALLGAKVGADLIGRGLVVSADEEGVALHLGNSEVGGSISLVADEGGKFAHREPRPFSADGDLRLMEAKIGDTLDLRSARIQAHGPAAVTADGVEIDSSLRLNGAEIAGEISFVGAIIGGDTIFSGAMFTSASGEALALDGADVTGNVLFTGGFAATGAVRLVGSTLNNALHCESATFANAGGVALALNEATIGTLIYKSVTVNGGIQLFRTKAGILSDDVSEGGVGSWGLASPLVLTGFTVERFHGVDSLAARKRWLLKNDHYDPGTWQSLIELYRTHGRDGDARGAAVARERDRLRRGGLRWWQTIGPWIFDGAIGYGYRPLRAGAWAVLFVGAFWLAVHHGDSHIHALKDAPDPKPNSFVYALDVFVPIVDFGETKHWRVDGWLEWLQWSMIALGWTLTTFFVAGFTRLVRS